MNGISYECRKFFETLSEKKFEVPLQLYPTLSLPQESENVKTALVQDISFMVFFSPIFLTINITIVLFSIIFDMCFQRQDNER